MTIAVIMLDIKDNRQECCGIFNRLEQYSKLPDSVDRLLLCDPGAPAIDFATLVPVTTNYADLSLNPDDEDSFKKLFMFLMPYDRVVYLSSNLAYKDDISVLWSESLEQHLLYACHLSDGSFNDDTLVFNHNLLLGFHDALLCLARMHLFDGYGRTCRAVLNGYFCHTKRKVGDLLRGLILDGE